MHFDKKLKVICTKTNPTQPPQAKDQVFDMNSFFKNIGKTVFLIYLALNIFCLPSYAQNGGASSTSTKHAPENVTKTKRISKREAAFLKQNSVNKGDTVYYYAFEDVEKLTQVRKENPEKKFRVIRYSDLTIIEEISKESDHYYAEKIAEYNLKNKEDVIVDSSGKERKLAQNFQDIIRHWGGFVIDNKIVSTYVLGIGKISGLNRKDEYILFKKLVNFATFNKVKNNGYERVLAQDPRSTFFYQSHPLEITAKAKAEAFQRANAAAKKDKPKQFSLGTPIPAFSLPSTDGTTATQAIFKGKLTLINFFFDKCAPCIREVPALNAFAQKHPEFQYIGLTFDSLTAVHSYIKDFQFEWKIIADAFDLIETLHVSGFPAFALIDENANVIGIGSLGDSDDTKKSFDDKLMDWINKYKPRSNNGSH